MTRTLRSVGALLTVLALAVGLLMIALPMPLASLNLGPPAALLAVLPLLSLGIVLLLMVGGECFNFYQRKRGRLDFLGRHARYNHYDGVGRLAWGSTPVVGHPLLE